uniref:Uncharacterized protein n=1 Tax=Panagrolaimus superbus TaxID=310955 RepID=A0A914Y7A3_9BILA
MAARTGDPRSVGVGRKDEAWQTRGERLVRRTTEGTLAIGSSPGEVDPHLRCIRRTDGCRIAHVGTDGGVAAGHGVDVVAETDVRQQVGKIVAWTVDQVTGEDVLVGRLAGKWRPGARRIDQARHAQRAAAHVPLQRAISVVDLHAGVVAGNRMSPCPPFEAGGALGHVPAETRSAGGNPRGAAIAADEHQVGHALRRKADRAVLAQRRRVAADGLHPLACREEGKGACVDQNGDGRCRW